MSHDKLALKLHQYGVRGDILTWIKSFLANRSQTVVLDNEHSDSVPVTSGVLKVSVLGLILFLVYINDLPVQTKSTARLFTDDTAIYLAVFSIQDARLLQVYLDKLQ